MTKWIWLLLFIAACAGRPTVNPSMPAPEIPGDDSATGTTESATPEQEADVEPPPAAPAPSSSYATLGKTMRSHSEDAVIQEASKILGKNPRDIKALNAMAVIYIVNRKLEMAKIVLARATKLYPNDASLACNLGIVYFLNEKIPEALAEFQRALNIDQGHAEANYHLGALHMRYKNAEAALPLLKRAYSKLPKGVAGPHYAEALRMTRQSRDAEKVFQDLKAESSRDSALVLGYASLLVEDIKDKKRGLKMVDRIRLLTEDAGILRRADDLASKGEALH